MIIRDEVGTISRCIESVAPYISHWAIVDTGSVDGTPAVAQSALATWPGKWTTEPWTNDFAAHRNRALALAKSVVTNADSRILFVDADEVLKVDYVQEFRNLLFTTRVLSWWAEDGDWRFRKVGVVRMMDAIGWRGKLHEYLELPSAVHEESQEVQNFAHLKYGHDGYRRRNSAGTASDMLSLGDMYADVCGENDYRVNYFRARTLEVASDWLGAAGYFRLAIKQSACQDDRWQAWWGLGRVLMQQKDFAGAAHAFTTSIEVAPDRAEPIVELSNIASALGRYEEAKILAYRALEMQEPTRSSMYDRSAYGWRATDALCVAAHKLRDRIALFDSVRRYRQLFQSHRIPDSEKKRVRKNMKLAMGVDLS